MQSLIEKNPELRHALSDPSTLQSILSAASNPAAYNEMLRGHDRALSNLETMPEGFSHLKRVYSKLQEPMYEAMSSGRQKTSTMNNFDEKSNMVKRELPTTPVPNPWQRNQKPNPKSINTSTHTSTNTAVSTLKRKYVSSSDLLLSNHYNEQQQKHPEEDVRRITKSNVNDPFLASILFGPSGKYASQLEQLHALGFGDDEGENLPALREADGDLDATVEMIRVMRASRLELEGGSESEEGEEDKKE